MSKNVWGAVLLKSNASQPKKDLLAYAMRIAIIAMVICLFIPALNPTRMSALVSNTASFFTTGISYDSLISGFGRALKKGWIEKSVLVGTYIGSLMTCIGIAASAVGCAVTLGENKLKRLGSLISSVSCIFGLVGMIILTAQYSGFENASNPDKIQASFPIGIAVFFAMLLICTGLSAAYFFAAPKAAADETYYMQPKYTLFLMMIPFIILIFLFSYLPLWGWRYAFFDYTPGSELTADNFVGFKWFTYLFENSATRSDIIRVLTNTLAMSALGILTSWIPLAFAIFLSEIKCNPVRRVIQTVTTIPNFISWVLVYTFAFALFSTEGFVNTFLMDLGATDTAVDFLMGDSGIWLKMLGWNLWKSLGWNAIIYIAAISGIDQQLYEAATIDGAGRFRKMWSITLPGLLPTFFVQLLLNIAGILSNGMDQYLVFKNATNKGLVDPDSMTQTFEEASAAYRDGAAFMNLFHWMGGDLYNTEEHVAEGKAMYAITPNDAKNFVDGLNVNGGERIWAIGSKTDEPELCMSIINWLCTPEGNMIMTYGPKGVCWDYNESGKA